jgi:hypothetical protein
MLAIGSVASANPFKGKTFEVKMGEVGKKQDVDKLVFFKGKFTSVDCTQWGFGSTKYQAKNTGSSWTFSARAKSKTEGNAQWKGTLSGSMLKGTMRWTKKGQKPIVYAFTGKVSR